MRYVHRSNLGLFLLTAVYQEVSIQFKVITQDTDVFLLAPREYQYVAEKLTVARSHIFSF